MASLLKDIRNAALEADEPIANVLRKCAVLGTQLKSNDLREWALQELNGYDDEDDVPEYRRVPAPLMGNFTGRFGTGYTNVGVPAINLPEKLRERARSAVFTHGVAGLEALLEGGDGDRLQFSWPGDWLTWIHSETKWNDGMILYAAWQVVGKANVAETIDAIRNRVLEFCLRLEEEIPELMSDDDDSALPSGAEAAASQVVNQVIVFGPVGNIANASPGANQAARVAVKRNDLSGLAAALSGFGVPPEEIEKLRAAIETETERAGKAARPCAAWYKRAKQAVASGTWSLAQGATISTIRGAILSYLGLG